MSVGKFLLGVWRWFKGVIAKMPEAEKAIIKASISVVDFLKNADESHPEILNILQSAFPFIPNIHEILAKAATGLRIIQAENNTDPAATISAIVTQLKTIDPEFSTDFLNSLAAHIAVDMSDGKFDIGEMIYTMKLYYDHEHKKNEDGE